MTKRIPKDQEPQQEQQEQEQPDLLEKLKQFGIEPNQVMAALNPLVEASVVKSLEKLHLAEAIDKRMGDIETKLTQRIESIASQVSQAQGQGSEAQGHAQPADSGNTQLRDSLIAAVAQKFLGGGDSGGTGELERLTKYLDLTRNIADAFYAPIQEAELRAQRRLTGQLELYRKAGASADKATEMVIEDGHRGD